MTDELLIERRFELHARVGRGGAGDVFRATDRETGRTVAVKRMLPATEDGAARERFGREVRLLARVDDPRVVRYVAHGVDAAGTACLVVEWLEGEDLARRVRRGPLSAADAIDAIGQAAHGLSALHRAGIVHRDVKPGNLFLVAGDDGRLRVKVIDLGIARALGERTLTSVGVTLGTPYYMSPEQARGEDRVTPATDVFSLGVVLFELIAGRRPFTGDDFFAVIAKIVLQEPPRLRDVVPSVPPVVDAIVRRAMSRDPEARFGTARELADALADVVPWTLPSRVSGTMPAVSSSEATTRVTSALSVSGEQRVITALFAGLPADDAHAEQHAFESIVAEHGASCHATLGHRRIAIFGAAHTLGDEAPRAARAALAVAARLPRVALAIATGRALAGATGVTGDLLERGAGRLGPVMPRPLAGANAGPIRLDEPTARLLDGHFVVEKRGDGWLLAGLRGAPAARGMLAGRAVPFVGRDREIGALTALYAESAAEPVARVAVVTGPAGIGKSRIREELCARLAREDPAPEILLARASPLAEASAFGVLGQAIRKLAGIVDGEPLAEQQSKLAARIGRRAPTTVALLGELSGVPAQDAAIHERDPVLMGDLMRAAFIEWLDAECAAQPVVIILEDLHWADRPSVRFVDAALRVLEGRPLLVVALGRPEAAERFPAVFADRGAQELRLGPLSARAAERFVRAALGDLAPTAAVQRIVARGEGNAFYIEELVRASQGGADGTGEALPDTVLGMVQARLDALGPQAKRILRAASVFGQTFWRGGVALLLGEPPEKIAEALARLVELEVLTERPVASISGSRGPAVGGHAVFPGEVEYGFRHMLVREAAYAMLAEADRKVGHRLAAGFLEAAGESDPALLALHFERGGEPVLAARHSLRAASLALAGNDFAAAIDHAERIVALPTGISSSESEERGRAFLVQAEARRWRGDLAAAADAAKQAASALPRGDTAWFHAVREVIAASGRLARYDAVLAWADDALAASASLPSVEAASALFAALAPAAGQLLYAGNAEGAARVIGEMDRLAADVPLDPLAVARLHQVRALLANHAGDVEEALAEHEAAHAAFERAGDRRGGCLALANLGYARADLGQHAEAEDALRRAQALAEHMGLGTIAPLALHNLGAVLHRAGRLAEAREAETRAALAFERAHDPRLEGASRVYLARILFDEGRMAESEAEARRVLDHAETPAPIRAGALSALAQVLLATDRAADALAATREAAATLDELGAIEDFGTFVGVVRTRALLESGDREGARAAIASALVRLMTRAARLGERARAGFLRDVPDHAACVALAVSLEAPEVSPPVR